MNNALWKTRESLYQWNYIQHVIIETVVSVPSTNKSIDYTLLESLGGNVQTYSLLSEANLTRAKLSMARLFLLNNNNL